MRYTHIVKCWLDHEIIGYFFSYADASKAIEDINKPCYIIALELLSHA